MSQHSAGTSDSAAPRGASRAPAIIILAVALVHVGLTRWSWSQAPLQNDSGLFSYVGWRIDHGAKLYSDLWEVKPPGIYYTFAACTAVDVDGGDRVAFWLDAALSAAILLLIWRTASRMTGCVASAVATLAAGLVLNHRILADWGLNCEKFVALFAIIAVLLLLRRSRSLWHMIAVGVCFGIAGLYKQTAVLLPVSLAIALCVERASKRVTTTAVLRGVVGVIAGCAMVWLPVLGWMASSGTLLAFWHQAIVYEFLRVGSSDITAGAFSNGGHLSAVWDTLLLASVSFVPAVLGLVIWWRSAPEELARTAEFASGSAERVVSRECVMCFCGLHLLLVLGVFAITPFGYGHYVLEAIPAAAILTAYCVESMVASRGRARQRWLVTAAAMVALSAWTLRDHLAFTFDVGDGAIYRAGYAARRTFVRDIAAQAQANSAAGDAVLVWPVDYGMSYLMQRRSPLETSNADVIHKGHGYRLDPPMEVILKSLDQEPPMLIVDHSLLGGQVMGDRGISLFLEPKADHRHAEGRTMALFQQWVQSHYGGQTVRGGVMWMHRGQEWQSVLTRSLLRRDGGA